MIQNYWVGLAMTSDLYRWLIRPSDKNSQEWREQNQVPDIFDPPSTESKNASPQAPQELLVYSKPFTFEEQFETDWRIHVGHAAPVEEASHS
jgi:hypothetical protein